MRHPRRLREPFSLAAFAEPARSRAALPRSDAPFSRLVKLPLFASCQKSTCETLNPVLPDVRSNKPAASTNAAATSSRAVLLVSLLTSLLEPWSSLRTVATARDAARRDREQRETAKGPSLTLERSALMSKLASDHRVTRGITGQGTPASRNSSSRNRSQMRFDGCPHVSDISFMSVFAGGTRSPSAQISAPES